MCNCEVKHKSWIQFNGDVLILALTFSKSGERARIILATPLLKSGESDRVGESARMMFAIPRLKSGDKERKRKGRHDCNSLVSTSSCSLLQSSRFSDGYSMSIPCLLFRRLIEVVFFVRNFTGDMFSHAEIESITELFRRGELNPSK